MNNFTWVCFDCRVSYRRPKKHNSLVICSICKENCYNIGDATPVPKRRETKKWQQLRKSYSDLVRNGLPSEIETVRLKHDIEQGEARLEVLRKSQNRKATLKKIDKCLRQRHDMRKKT
ncbi:hypothetical protein [Spartinivicinus ruber]|uniref:hypothetical protein n=1 Tax=Spartinivicinus ruber TaxID=2683272 RepID=UPI0013D74257|nr:hypothetical protein [Spartinivicinus ruber]